MYVPGFASMGAPLRAASGTLWGLESTWKARFREDDSVDPWTLLGGLEVN